MCVILNYYLINSFPKYYKFIIFVIINYTKICVQMLCVSVTHLCIYTETDLLVVVLVQSPSLLISFYFQPIKETLHSEINCLSAQAY